MQIEKGSVYPDQQLIWVYSDVVVVVVVVVVV